MTPVVHPISDMGPKLGETWELLLVSTERRRRMLDHGVQNCMYTPLGGENKLYGILGQGSNVQTYGVTLPRTGPSDFFGGVHK